MLFYNDKKIRERIESDYRELENYKNSYSKRISLYNTYLDTLQIFENGNLEKNDLNKEDIEKKKQILHIQINKIDNNLKLLTTALENIDATGNIGLEKNKINRYNQKYKEIKNNYINHSVFEENITEKYINELMNGLAKTLKEIKEEHTKEMENVRVEKVMVEKANIQNEVEKKENVIQENQAEKKENIIQENTIENQIEKKETHLKSNNTLLISEKQGKVILPYSVEEVLEIFNNKENNYNSVEEVIEDKFTRDISDYKVQFVSRYAETMKLIRYREHYSFIDAVAIATEMMKKRFLHPAIISACRNLNELDVYLDCLDKNELEDFKIFNIKYELYPMVVKSNNNRKIAKHSENTELKIISIIKSIFKRDNKETNKVYYE